MRLTYCTVLFEKWMDLVKIYMILTTWNQSRLKNFGSGSSKILRLHQFRLRNTGPWCFFFEGISCQLFKILCLDHRNSTPMFGLIFWKSGTNSATSFIGPTKMLQQPFLCYLTENLDLWQHLLRNLGNIP
jgi:hypothetical protein